MTLHAEDPLVGATDLANGMVVEILHNPIARGPSDPTIIIPSTSKRSASTSSGDVRKAANRSLASATLRTPGDDFLGDRRCELARDPPPGGRTRARPADGWPLSGELARNPPSEGEKRPTREPAWDGRGRLARIPSGPIGSPSPVASVCARSRPVRSPSTDVRVSPRRPVKGTARGPHGETDPALRRHQPCGAPA